MPPIWSNLWLKYVNVALKKQLIYSKMEALLKFVQDEFVTKKEFPEFSAGDTITVYYEIKEGEKTRTQFFKELLSKEEVLELLKPSLSVKCQVL